MFGSLFVLTFIGGVVSNDSDVTDEVAAYLFIITVTVLPGFYLIRRARRRRARVSGRNSKKQTPSPVDSVQSHEHPTEGWGRVEQSDVGSPPRTTTAARLTISRPSTMGGRAYTVLFDDRPIGRLQPGVTGEYEIPPGLHWVIVKTRRQESNTTMIEPREGDQIRLECQPASGGEIDGVGRNVEGILLQRLDP